MGRSRDWLPPAEEKRLDRRFVKSADLLFQGLISQARLQIIWLRTRRSQLLVTIYKAKAGGIDRPHKSKRAD